jgi:hypothetical protein
MKPLFFFSFFVCSLVANGTILTVSNNPQKPAQYSTIMDAVTASASGDTIYIHGSPNFYTGTNVVNKKLIFIGPGFEPDKELPYPATITFQLNLIGDLCSGSEFHGLTFRGNLILQSCDSVKVLRNYFWSQVDINLSIDHMVTYKNIEFTGNYFYNNEISATQPISNFRFVNNVIFLGTIHGFKGGANMLFDHNVFYGPSSGSSLAFSQCEGMMLSNNIFIRRKAGAGTTKCTFNNNITYLTGEDAPWLMNQNADAGGNLAGQSPQMVDQAKLEAGLFGLLHDFTVAAGPANNAGSDGKDLGLLYDPVGIYNWMKSPNSTLPFIYHMKLGNPTIESGGSLSISIEAKSNN